MDEPDTASPKPKNQGVFLCTLGFWVPKPWNMALNKGVWDPKLKGTKIKGTNLKSLNNLTPTLTPEPYHVRGGQNYGLFLGTHEDKDYIRKIYFEPETLSPCLCDGGQYVWSIRMPAHKQVWGLGKRLWFRIWGANTQYSQWTPRKNLRDYAILTKGLVYRLLMVLGEHKFGCISMYPKPWPSSLNPKP